MPGSTNFAPDRRQTEMEQEPNQTPVRAQELQIGPATFSRMALTIPRAAYMASRRRPIRGNLLVRAGVIGVGTVRPRHGKVVVQAETRIRVTGGTIPESRSGGMATLGVLLLGSRFSRDPTYASIPLPDGTEVVFRVDGITADILATQLRTELEPLGASVTIG